MSGHRLFAVLLFLVLLTVLSGFASSATFLRTENFTADPGWDGVRNRYSTGCREVTQDFGYSRTRFAGGDLGEIGGRVARSTAPALYADTITGRGLDDTLFASGRIVLLENADGGVFVGWFNGARQGWRPVNFVGFRLDEADVYLTYTTGTSKAQGLRTGVSLQLGRPYFWSLSYDPKGNAGKGTIRLSISGTNSTLDLLPGHREEGALLNRFGLFNLQEPGGYEIVYLDDLSYCGKTENFSIDPGWLGSGNRATFRDCRLRGTQDFGYSQTNHTGSLPGEVGGLIWRDERPAYYADEVGRLTLDNSLFASGRLTALQASSDSGFLIGWFDKDKLGWPPQDFLGAAIEGPSRAGHYFRLMYHTSRGALGESVSNPLVFPNNTVYRWEMAYDPKSHTFTGRLAGGAEISTTLPADAEAEFNRFGIVNIQAGGHEITAYLDDLTYTASLEMHNRSLPLAFVLAFLPLRRLRPRPRQGTESMAGRQKI